MIVKLESDAPDLWATIGQEKALSTAAASADLDNRPFTAAEQSLIATKLCEIKAHLLEDQEFAAEQAATIEREFAYLKEAAGRTGRKDWLNILLGGLISLAIGLALDPEKARGLLRLVGTVFQSLWGMAQGAFAMTAYRYNPCSKPLSEFPPEELNVLREVSEGWFVDYKSEAISPKDFGKHLSAFANQFGGWLFVGVKEGPQKSLKADSFPGIPTADVGATLVKIREGVSAHVSPSLYFDHCIFDGPVDAIGLQARKCIISKAKAIARATKIDTVARQLRTTEPGSINVLVFINLNVSHVNLFSRWKYYTNMGGESCQTESSKKLFRCSETHRILWGRLAACGGLVGRQRAPVRELPRPPACPMGGRPDRRPAGSAAPGGPHSAIWPIASPVIL